jgi:ActR/RegA family two-component response regulator
MNLIGMNSANSHSMMKRLRLKKDIKRVFIAEADAELGRDISDYLSERGIDSVLYKSKEEVLSDKDMDFDAAIIDANIEGFRVLMELREKKNDMLIILISGNNIDSNRMEALIRVQITLYQNLLIWVFF